MKQQDAPPHSAEAERAVLGAILLNSSVIPEAMAILEPFGTDAF